MFNSVKDLSIQIAKLPQQMTEKFDDKYAPIWAAKAWVLLIGAVGMILIGAVMGQILINSVQAFF